MKKTNNTNTITVTREDAILALSLSVSALDNVQNDKNNTLAMLSSAQEKVDSALSVYSSIVEREFYDCILRAENPVMEIASRLTWSKPYIKVSRDKYTDKIVRTVELRRTRINLLSFVEYAREVSDNADMFADVVESLEAFSAVMVDYVQGNVRKEQGVSTKKAVESLSAVMQALGCKYAQSKDVRFIAYAVTRASAENLGELKNFGAREVAPYIMDALHVRAENVGYKFESKEEKAAE